MLQDHHKTPSLPADTQPTFDEASAKLRYSPADGSLYWRVNVGRHIRAGDEAGTTDRLGRVIISLGGRKYQALYIIWLLVHGAWPTRPLRCRSDRFTLSSATRRAGRQNLTLDNIEEYEPTPSANKNTQRARKHRQTMLARKAALLSQVPDVAMIDPHYPTIRYSQTSGRWVVHERSALFPGLAPADARFLGYFDTLDAARAAFDRHTARLQFLADNPAPVLTPDLATIPATSGSVPTLFLQDAHEAFAYNPATGEVLWRAPASRAGLIATKPTTDGTALRIDFRSRRYAAQSMAWFLTHGRWPRPRSITWRNGDGTDNRLTNLKDTAQDA